MEASQINRSNALQVTMERPLRKLTQYMKDDAESGKKIWGPGVVLFTLLAIQYHLGEEYSLNGQTFLDIQDGFIRYTQENYRSGITTAKTPRALSGTTPPLADA
jgi:hypothetical protein